MNNQCNLNVFNVPKYGSAIVTEELREKEHKRSFKGPMLTLLYGKMMSSLVLTKSKVIRE